MKRIMMMMTVAVSICALAFGCGSSTPQGDDSEVTDLVIKIYKENDLARRLIMAGDTGYITYKRLQKEVKIKNNKEAEKELARVNKILDETKVSINNIRTLKQDEKLKLGVYSGELKIIYPNKDEIIYSVHYSAQRTSDGNLYVKMQTGFLR